MVFRIALDSGVDARMPIPAFDSNVLFQDICNTMAWSILRSKALVPPRKALREARESLVSSLVQPQERRGEFRLFHPIIGTSLSPHGEMLLNVSRSGIAVGVRKKCTFARGEWYKIALDDGATQADLEGKVCWTRSTWPRGSVEAKESEYFQAAGLVIAEPLSRVQEKRWKVLRELAQDGSAVLGLKISPVR